MKECFNKILNDFFTGKELITDSKGLPHNRVIEEAYMADAEPGCLLAITTYEDKKIVTHLFKPNDPIEFR